MNGKNNNCTKTEIYINGVNVGNIRNTHTQNLPSDSAVVTGVTIYEPYFTNVVLPFFEKYGIRHIDKKRKDKSGRVYSLVIPKTEVIYKGKKYSMRLYMNNKGRWIDFNYCELLSEHKKYYQDILHEILNYIKRQNR